MAFSALCLGKGKIAIFRKQHVDRNCDNKFHKGNYKRLAKKEQAEDHLNQIKQAWPLGGTF